MTARMTALNRGLFGNVEVVDHLIAARAKAAVFEHFLAVLPATPALFPRAGDIVMPIS